MKKLNPLHTEAQRLLEIVRTEVEREIPASPNKIVAEGKLVLENALAFVAAVKDDKTRALLSGTSLRVFLGATWIDLCEEAYQQCARIQGLIERHAI